VVTGGVDDGVDADRLASGLKRPNQLMVGTQLNDDKPAKLTEIVTVTEGPHDFGQFCALSEPYSA
jgi:hypothetical protein